MTTALIQRSPVGSGNSATFSAPTTASSTIYAVVIGFNFTGATLSASSPTLDGSGTGFTATKKHEDSPANGTSGAVLLSIWELAGVPAGKTTVSFTVSGGSALNVFLREVSGLGATPVLDRVASVTHPNALSPDSGLTAGIQFSDEFVLAANVILGVAMSAPGSPWATNFQAGSSAFCSAADVLGGTVGSTFEYAQTTGGGAPWASAVLTFAPTGSGSGTVVSGSPVAPPATSSVSAGMEFTASAASSAQPGAASATADQEFTAGTGSTAAPGAGTAVADQEFTATGASVALPGVAAGSAAMVTESFTASAASTAMPAQSAGVVASAGSPNASHNPWFESVLTDTLTRLRAGTTDDVYGNTVLDWSSPDQLILPVRVAPPIIKTRLGSHAADEDMAGRDAIRYDLEAWLSTDDVTALDRCLYKGKTYEVTGEPGNRSDMDGYYMYSKILLREVTG